ncbi:MULTISPECIES: phosphopentomutase [unclassified Roseitalea]|uniref:phosphopentomutase n=1 Tax=unclassified Roseitalea TaxID=2639107 RepID=UPI00273E49AC|nr:MULTISPECIES: phosphopentomutase [unclassified Roseitalea]
MARAFLIVLDSVGIGGAPDAAAFGDAGANTVGHIIDAAARGAADNADRSGPLACPNLAALGLFNAVELASNHEGAAALKPDRPAGLWGAAEEVSNGKDTPSGHWEIAGVPVRFDWGYFPHEVPAFPQDLLERIHARAGLEGSLGNRHASGTEIIAELGEEHIRTGKPIFYTSGDSVFQIAAHEDRFGLERLYALCETVRALVDDLNIGRVIARPFIGTDSASFKRTGNRRDYSVPPPEPTLLDRTLAAGGRVLAVGKIADIFAHQGVSAVRKASGNAAIGEATLQAIDEARDGDLVVTNFVDFDMLYGHRRDVAGYAAALEAFDRFLPRLTGATAPGDLMIITADHGCDPTWRGTDHTRERVPVLGLRPGFGPAPVGLRPTFADMGETLAAHLGLAPGPHGRSFLDLTAGDA